LKWNHVEAKRKVVVPRTTGERNRTHPQTELFQSPQVGGRGEKRPEWASSNLVKNTNTKRIAKTLEDPSYTSGSQGVWDNEWIWGKCVVLGLVHETGVMGKER